MLRFRSFGIAFFDPKCNQDRLVYEYHCRCQWNWRDRNEWEQTIEGQAVLESSLSLLNTAKWTHALNLQAFFILTPEDTRRHSCAKIT
jgi:hypothetical protein